MSSRLLTGSDITTTQSLLARLFASHFSTRIFTRSAFAPQNQFRVRPSSVTTDKNPPHFTRNRSLATMSSSNPQTHNNADFQLGELFNVKDKVALVTGGGSGIGLMATQALAVNGAKGMLWKRLQRFRG